MQLNPPSARHRRIWFLLGWGIVAAVVVLSLIPLEVNLGRHGDKVAHFLAYSSLSFWFGVVSSGRVRQLCIAIAFAAMGVAIEFLQGLTDYRTFDTADMMANGIGAALGWALVQTPLRNGLGWAGRLIGALTRKS